MRDFDICIEQPVLWHYIKIAFIISYVGSSIFIFNSIYSIFLSIYNKIAHKKDNFKIIYRCQKCQKEIKNIAANDDNMEEIIKLSVVRWGD